MMSESLLAGGKQGFKYRFGWDNLFTWKPFFKEMAGKLLEYRDRQSELIALLNRMDDGKSAVMPRTDINAANEKVPLAEIDCFTLFASFCRYISDANRQTQLEQFKRELKVSASLPQDFAGVPLVNNQSSWFFAYLQTRKKQDIPLLWDIASAAVEAGAEGLSEALWKQCLDVKQVGLAKLTIGLFWVNPDAFLPTDRNILGYLNAHQIDTSRFVGKATPLAAYLKLLQDVREVLDSDFAQVSYDAWKGSTNPVLSLADTDDPNEVAASMKILLTKPLNQILYGPPGTGKTYTTIEKAVEIIVGYHASHTEYKKEWDDLCKDGQIKFVTFHQSYGYEDFVEGLRPVIDAAEGTTQFEVRDGVLKQLALQALGYALQPLHGMGEQDAASDFDQRWNALLDQIETDSQKIYPGLRKASYRLSVSPRGNLNGTSTNESSASVLTESRERMARVWRDHRDKAEINSTDYRETFPNTNFYSLTAAVFKALKAVVVKTEAKQSTFFPGNEEARDRASDYLRRGDASGYYLPSADKQLRYVLVIDEINRGNISRILGELITLLEEDKRLGAANALTVTLPFSGDTFGLPPNLYLLGTMNTADKSIALVDIALRRRFTFEEMRPRFDAQTCSDMTEMMCRIMTEVNRRILLRKDRDHRIGHAYFAQVDGSEKFNQVMRDCILPLLSEYFWGDWDGLRYVLGDKDETTGFVRRIAGADAQARNRWQWYFDADEEDLSNTTSFDALQTLAKNYGTSAPIVETQAG